MDVTLDGTQGNRRTVGTPYINRCTEISFGVESPNNPSLNSGDLWISNLRTANANVRSGLARRANAAFILGNNFATINARYREVDSGFTEIDQTSTHFQHSTELGGDYSSNGIKLFAQPLAMQFSYTHQDLYTEPDLLQNPYFISLPDSTIDNATGSITYTKNLGKDFGRLTNIRLSGSTNYENDVFEPVYLLQPGVQGNTQKGEEVITLATTYDAPPNLFGFPIGANQFNETYNLTYDTQYFDNPTLSAYDRKTKNQIYSWSNTTELVKNLVVTPGYTLTLTDAEGNTNTPGVPGSVPDYEPFQQRYQPKGGVVYKGIPGVIPSVDYTGSVLYDYVSYPDGTRFDNANNLNYGLNLTPATWFGFLQKTNMNIFASHTETATAEIPGYGTPESPLLNFDQKWFIDPPFYNNNTQQNNSTLLATETTADQLNATFRLFDFWDFRPTGTWTNGYSQLSQGTNPVQQTGETLGLTTIINKKLLTIPVVKASLDSLQLQYTYTDSLQYDSSTPPQLANETTSYLYGITIPYTLNKTANGNIHLQRTVGSQDGLATSNAPTTQLDDQATIEFDQRFAPNMVIHIPFTHWKIALQDSIELKATFLMDFVNNQSTYVYNELQTQKYRATLDFNYNALKNLRVGLGIANEYFTNTLQSQLGYTLWQADVSAEARF